MTQHSPALSGTDAAACSLAPGALGDRVDDWRSLTAQALHREIEPGRVLSTYPNNPHIARRFAELIDRRRSAAASSSSTCNSATPCSTSSSATPQTSRPCSPPCSDSPYARNWGRCARHPTVLPRITVAECVVPGAGSPCPCRRSRIDARPAGAPAAPPRFASRRLSGFLATAGSCPPSWVAARWRRAEPVSPRWSGRRRGVELVAHALDHFRRRHRDLAVEDHLAVHHDRSVGRRARHLPEASMRPKPRRRPRR
jgi:hypothetical protein